MNEKFILNVFDKFENSSAVLLHIKEGEAELTLKKEAAYQNAQATVPFALHNAPMQPIAGADGSGYTACTGHCSSAVLGRWSQPLQMVQSYIRSNRSISAS